MTLELVLLMSVVGVAFMGTLMSAPKKAFEKGGVRLAARVETQIATGAGFKSYPNGETANDKRVPWIEKE